MLQTQKFTFLSKIIISNFFPHPSLARFNQKFFLLPLRGGGRSHPAKRQLMGEFLSMSSILAANIH